MSKTLKRILAVIIVAIFGAGMFFLGFYVRNLNSPDLAALKFVIDNYKKYYYEDQENYVEIMAESLLDAYSNYYTPEQYEIIKKSSKGVRAGIGIVVQNRSEGVYVSNVLWNSPCEVAGIKIGDYITQIKIGNEEFVDVNYDLFKEKMDSIVTGKKVTFKLSGDSAEYSVVAKEYNETFVSYSDSTGTYRFSDNGGKENLTLKKFENSTDVSIPSDTAYVKYKSFNGLKKDLYGSANQMKAVLEKFKSDKKKKLIVDLRSNGGGFMSIMGDVASHFVGVKNGSKVLCAKAVYKDGKVDKFTTPAVDYADYGFEKIIFLANSNTASASEALIGACLDYDYKNVVRVVLSQTKKDEKYVYATYGKGIMQTTFENPFGKDAIKLTTAKIYWPVSEVCIHGDGITKNLQSFKDKIIEAPYIENADYELIAALSL